MKISITSDKRQKEILSLSSVFISNKNNKITGPGDILSIIIKACGFDYTPGCGCQSFANQMNRWGWIGCLTTHRQEIVNWLVIKAKEQNIELKHENVFGLIEAAIYEYWTK